MFTDNVIVIDVYQDHQPDMCVLVSNSLFLSSLLLMSLVVRSLRRALAPVGA